MRIETLVVSVIHFVEAHVYNYIGLVSIHCMLFSYIHVQGGIKSKPLSQIIYKLKPVNEARFFLSIFDTKLQQYYKLVLNILCAT